MSTPVGCILEMTHLAWKHEGLACLGRVLVQGSKRGK